MTKEEKIQLIKDVEKGDFEKLNKLKNEKKKYSFYFFPVFFYLCEHGRIITPSLTDNPLLCLEDLEELQKLTPPIDFETLSLGTMLKIAEIFESIEVLEKQGNLAMR